MLGVGELLWVVGFVSLAIGVHLWAYGGDPGRWMTFASFASFAASSVLRLAAGRRVASASPLPGQPAPEPQASPAVAPLPDDEVLEEVRVAMALNGGVSLAVWMGGCAVELDSGRRAHIAEEDISVPGLPAPPNALKARVKQFLTGEPPAPAPISGALPDRTIYHAVCKAFRRRLVLDVFSGASAGGINGALLAGAICHRRRLHPDFLREKWLGLGDFSRLLQKTSTAHPRSLMQGDLFHEGLDDTFAQLLGWPSAADPRVLLPGAQAAGLNLEVLNVKLEVTTTDVVGVRSRFVDDWDTPLSAQEYRARFRFHHPTEFTPARLAQAARASASFPGAFEPWRTSRTAAKLARLGRNRWVVDGGLLNNAPIRVALDLIPAQPAYGQVRRFACYVNPDPDDAAGKAIPSIGPKLTSVGGYVVKLPRSAPFVDELRAVERATRQAALGAELELELLELPWATMQSTASALLMGYRRRRRLQSLEELLRDPAAAVRAFERLDGGPELPWIPSGFPPAAGSWGWGVSAGERVLHLFIDLLRLATNRLPFAQRGELFAARAVIDAQLGVLADAHAKLLDDAPLRKKLRELAKAPAGAQSTAVAAQLTTMMQPYDATVLAALQTGADAAAGVAGKLATVLGAPLCVTLFGAGWNASEPLGAAAFQSLVGRTLGVEVIRRATWTDENVESGQRVRFAQLTPYAPGLIFAKNPRASTGWATPAQKLTGIKLGHFAAFYRGSWRANDFMWGRLDAAARVVDLLVDHERATELQVHGGGVQPWSVLASAVLPTNAVEDQRWLVHEVLDPAAAESAASPPSADVLRPQLAAALQADLTGGGEGRLTRIVLTRAAQYEVLRHELPWLDREASLDTKLGGGTAPLNLETSGALKPAIRNLRPPAAPLPARLGCDKEELASSLALRTMAHTGLVTLGTARTANRVLGSILFPLRAVLLPVAGFVSRVPAYRLTAVLGFWAAALYVTERMLTLDPSSSAALHLLLSRGTLVALLAALVVVGVVAVPAVRCVLGSGAARWAQLVCAAALLASGGAIAAGAAWAGEAEWEDLLLAPDAHPLPDWLLGAALALVAGRLVSQFRPLRSLLQGFLEKPFAGWLSALAFVALSAGFIYYSVEPVWDVRDQGRTEWIAVMAAIFAAPTVAGLYAFVRNPVKRVGGGA